MTLKVKIPCHLQPASCPHAWPWLTPGPPVTVLHMGVGSVHSGTQHRLGPSLWSYIPSLSPTASCQMPSSKVLRGLDCYREYVHRANVGLSSTHACIQTAAPSLQQEVPSRAHALTLQLRCLSAPPIWRPCRRIRVLVRAASLV